MQTPTTMIDREIETLRAQIHGTVLVPGDDGYDAARQVFPGDIDRHPAVIVRAADAADVGRAIAFARDAGLELAVRSGGHSAAGYSTTDGGLVIDLRGLDEITIDPEARTAWAGA
ncbi:MAG TPA: FAD-binding protein, partial [Candidatus Limnocylindrales bacterium]|nr:FAD-binding protein [Candidatus Limnocylindrales bacterium]